jgi:hypothetical protein
MFRLTRLGEARRTKAGIARHARRAIAVLDKYWQKSEGSKSWVVSRFGNDMAAEAGQAALL